MDPDSLTYSSHENIGAFGKYMRQKPSTEHGLVEIDEPEGCIFEADKGVPVLVLITKLQSEQLKVDPFFPYLQVWYPEPLLFPTRKTLH